MGATACSTPLLLLSLLLTPTLLPCYLPPLPQATAVVAMLEKRAGEDLFRKHVATVVHSGLAALAAEQAAAGGGSAGSGGGTAVSGGAAAPSPPAAVSGEPGAAAAASPGVSPLKLVVVTGGGAGGGGAGGDAAPPSRLIDTMTFLNDLGRWVGGWEVGVMVGRCQRAGASWQALHRQHGVWSVSEGEACVELPRLTAPPPQGWLLPQGDGPLCGALGVRPRRATHRGGICVPRVSGGLRQGRGCSAACRTSTPRRRTHASAHSSCVPHAGRCSAAAPLPRQCVPPPPSHPPPAGGWERLSWP